MDGLQYVLTVNGATALMHGSNTNGVARRPTTATTAAAGKVAEQSTVKTKVINLPGASSKDEWGAVHYRFRNTTLDTDSLPCVQFQAKSISVEEFVKAIDFKRRPVFGDNRKLLDAGRLAVYKQIPCSSEFEKHEFEGAIPVNTTVLVRRVPSVPIGRATVYRHFVSKSVPAPIAPQMVPLSSVPTVNSGSGSSSSNSDKTSTPNSAAMNFLDSLSLLPPSSIPKGYLPISPPVTLDSSTQPSPLQISRIKEEYARHKHGSERFVRGVLPSGKVCQLCNMPGHWQHLCRLYKPPSPVDHLQTCRVCHATGHHASICPEREGGGIMPFLRHYFDAAEREKEEKKTRKRKAPSSDYVCNLCHTSGHWIEQCSLYVCRNCQQKGHASDTCTAPRQPRKQKSPQGSGRLSHSTDAEANDSALVPEKRTYPPRTVGLSDIINNSTTSIVVPSASASNSANPNSSIDDTTFEQFFNLAPESLLCTICNTQFKECVTIDCCFTSFCNGCISTRSECPRCLQNTKDYKLVPNTRVQALLL